MLDLQKEAAKAKVELNKEQLDQFQKYFEMLVETNKVMNLTAITEWDDVVIKHFVDSISMVENVRAAAPIKEANATSPVRLIDIGTGAGFPGIPIKIAYPGVQVTLLDSLQKRVGFLNQVCQELKLTDIDSVHARAEDGARDENLREQFDFAVSRAVARQSVLTEYCLPYVKVGGYFIAYKSGEIEEELEESKKAIETLGGKLVTTIPFSLIDAKGEEQGRSFVVIKKLKATPKKFPRKAGEVRKKPL